MLIFLASLGYITVFMSASLAFMHLVGTREKRTKENEVKNPGFERSRAQHIIKFIPFTYFTVWIIRFTSQILGVIFYLFVMLAPISLQSDGLSLLMIVGISAMLGLIAASFGVAFFWADRILNASHSQR